MSAPLRILCLSAPLSGHLDWGGYLATAAELVRRGHHVVWASGEAVARQVEAAGVAFLPMRETGWRWPPPPPLGPGDLPVGTQPQTFARLRAFRALDQWLDPERVLAAFDELTALVTQVQPDLIVAEMFILAAGLVAERAGVPFVVAGWPAHAPPTGPTTPGDDLTAALSVEARARMAKILLSSGLSGINISAEGPPALLSPTAHLSFWSESWFGGAHLLPQTIHVGGRHAPPLPPDPSLPNPDDKPWVLITLGSTFAQDPAFFHMAVEATQRLGAQPLVATGPATLPGLGSLHERPVVRESFTLRALLPYTAAAIHHGGAGTTHALILHAVPQVVVPHAGDQARQALGVQRAGIGVALRPAEVSRDRLARSLAAILPDRAPVRAAALRLQQEFAALGGVPRAATLLEAAARRIPLNPQGGSS
ncbi:MAG: glycosyltransferase [Caldilineaceae bacterium]